MSNKGRNLEVLAHHGLPVPRGFSLPADAYRTSAQAILEEIQNALPDSIEISRLFSELELSADAEAELESGLQLLTGVERFAVRSSGSIATDSGGVLLEDSTEKSFAGQFESYLNVPRSLVTCAVKKCWASLFNERSIEAFAGIKAYPSNSEMTVVIQEMIPARSSAVIMTVDPMGDGTTGAVEFTWGPCEAIVAGHVSPDEAVFEARTGKVISVTSGPKLKYVEHKPFSAFGESTLLRDNSKAQKGRLSLKDIELRRVISTGLQIEKIFGCPQDIELVVDPGGRIVVTQTRPVTALPISSNLNPIEATIQ